MKRELNLKCPYKVFKDTEVQSYYFFTDRGVKYFLYLTSADTYCQDFHLRDNVFELGFEKLGNLKPIFDLKIRDTILAFIEYLLSNHQIVLMFVTDVSDEKQHARNRLFNYWKSLTDTKQCFDKYDVEVQFDKTTIFTSMIVHQENIHLSEYRDQFLLKANELMK